MSSASPPPTTPSLARPFSLLRSLGVIACLMLMLSGLLLGVVVAIISVTITGKILAVGVALLTLLPLAFFQCFAQPLSRRRWVLVSASIVSLVALILGGLVLAAPTGIPPPGSPVQQRFSNGNTFPRYSLSNLVPEIEQVNLGLRLAPHLDNLFTPERERRVSGFTLNLYQTMERDPNFHALGSAMGGAYADIFKYSYPPGHYYLYIPRHAPPGPLPAIVFLHGSAGNFKVYTWVWSQLAEQLGYVIIAPSFGFGNWDQPGGVETVRAALADAQTVVKLDPQRIVLAGLSNGGLGVSLVADALPRQFCGCLLISPVLVDAITDSSEFQAKWAGRPLLVLSGENDERVSINYVRDRVQFLRQGGVDVHFVTYPGEDHFLFFSNRVAVLPEIATWLQALPNSPVSTTAH